jgi:uncharacterized protein YdhG (YjbR/CyaY superfamily)
MPNPKRKRKPSPRSGSQRPGSAAVDAYLTGLSPEIRAALERLRTLVRAEVPEAEDTISYKIPAFRYRGKILVWYAGFQDHASFFPGHLSRLTEFAKDIAPFASGKGTLRFDPKRPLPAPLVRRLVRARVREIERPGARVR